MKIVSATLLLAASSLMAQRGGELQTMSSPFQQAGTLASGPGWQVFPLGGRGGGLVTGSPVSAREVRKTSQTLSDGTVLENSSTMLFYRDSQGRTRTDETTPHGTVIILDPIAGLRITLDPANKTARRVNAPAVVNMMNAGPTLTQLEGEIQVLSQIRGAIQAKEQATTEDLGFQNQNGVIAQGTRTTLTIPQGQIGNNRDIHVVNERWYSKDLQMLVRSVNSDPRFGTTTYELTNISQAAPDPTLFQVPLGYTVSEVAGRGGQRK